MTPHQIARFWSKVHVGGRTVCWPWRGATDGRYGVWALDRVLHKAHRIAWLVWHGTLPSPDEVLRHACDSTTCCNPYHLSTGSQADNVRDAQSKGRHAYGVRNGLAKLNNKSVRAIRANPDNYTTAHLAHMYGVTTPTIRAVLNHHTWRHVGDSNE